MAEVSDKATLGGALPESVAVAALSLVHEEANEPAAMAITMDNPAGTLACASAAPQATTLPSAVSARL